MNDELPPIRDAEVARAFNATIEELSKASAEPNNEYGQMLAIERGVEALELIGADGGDATIARDRLRDVALQLGLGPAEVRSCLTVASSAP
jgi:hypothetical protein